MARSTKLRRTGGGTAPAAGTDYQNRVAAAYAVQILAESANPPPFDWPERSNLVSLRCEADHPVDDISVATSEDGIAYIQAKHTIALQTNATSILAGVFDQFVRQFLRTSPAGASDPRWDRPFDPARDRLVLATARSSSASITTTAPSLLSKLRDASGGALPLESSLNESERKVLNVFKAHAASAWRKACGAEPTQEELLRLLASVWIEAVDVDPRGSDERAALSALRQMVLRSPAQAASAWSRLITLCAGFARRRTGTTRLQLQDALAGASFNLKSLPGYQDDVRLLEAYSEAAVTSVKDFSEIKTGSGAPLKIHREIVPTLVQEAEKGSLLVTGDPGYGKSGALHDMADALKAAGHPVLFILADDVGLGGLASLQTEIGLSHPIVHVLENWRSAGTAFLVTDALDAARPPGSLEALRKLIACALKMEGRWHVVASVRRYELKTRTSLQELFPGEPVPGCADPEFPNIRHLLVGPLSSAELDQVVRQSPALGELIEQASANPGLRELLPCPFNIRLLADLLKTGVPVASLTPINTQLELLERYWKHRVIGEDGRGDVRERVLRLLVDGMVDTRSPRLAKARATTDAQAAETVPALQSLGIIRELQSDPNAEPQIAFTHHILFDYAVCRLVFRTTTGLLIERIRSDRELVVAFRPSVAMHFRAIWAAAPHNRKVFWDLALAGIAADGVPLVGKIIGPVVAAEEGKTLADFAPLFASLSGAEPVRSSAVLALQYLFCAFAANLSPTTPKADVWAHLARALSEQLPGPEYPLRHLLAILVEKPESLSVDQTRDVNAAACKLLQFALDQADAAGQPLVRSAAETVCRTFSSDPTNSGKALRRLLEPEHARRHGHSEILAMANHVQRIVASDPDLVEGFYRVGFGEAQDSDAPTPVGAPSRILNLSSTERQDWHHLHHRLDEVYHVFLAGAPFPAARALAFAINDMERRKHGDHEVIEMPFSFRGKSFNLRTDYSSIWDSSGYDPHDAVSHMLGQFVQLLTSVAGQDLDRFVRLVSELAVGCPFAMVWKRLLQAGTASPRATGTILAPLLTQPAVLTSYDTAQVLPGYIAAVVPVLSDAERLGIEQAIVALGKGPCPVADTQFKRRIRLVLLQSIPQELVATPAARRILSRAPAPPPPPAPAATVSSPGAIASQVAHATFVRQSRPEAADPLNQRLEVLGAPLLEFLEKRAAPNTAMPSPISLLPQVRALAAVLDRSRFKPIHRRHRAFAEVLVARSCAALAASPALYFRTNDLYLVRKRLLKIAAGTPVGDLSKIDRQFEAHTAWSWEDAAQVSTSGLLNVAGRLPKEDREIVRAIRRLSRSNSAPARLEVATRIGAIRNEDACWEILEAMVRDETSKVVLTQVAATLSATSNVKASALVEILLSRPTLPEGSSKLRSYCFGHFLRRYLQKGDPAALERVAPLVRESWKHEPEIRNLLHDVRSEGLFTLGAPAAPDERKEAIRQRTLDFVRLLAVSLASEFARLRQERPTSDPKAIADLKDRATAVRAAAATITSQVYFASGAFGLKVAKDEHRLDEPRRRRFFKETRAIIDTLAQIGDPHIAYELIETLASFLPFAPEEVFPRIGQVVVNAREGGMQYEYLVAEFLVTTVECMLMEYAPSLQRSSECRNALVDILDTFVAGGWTSAFKLTFRMSEVFR